MSYKTITFILLCNIFHYGSLAQANLDSSFWNLRNNISEIVHSAIDTGAFPGCVVYASHQGKPFFFEAYGHHTYDSTQSVSKNDLYDLASITKVAAATVAIMKLYDDGLIDIDAPVAKYVNKLGGEWRHISIREVMAHHAGVESWIPYYMIFKKRNGNYRRNTIGTEDGDVAIASDLYIYDKTYEQIKKSIRRAKVDEGVKYRYSGLFFYLVPEIVQNLSGIDFETYLTRSVYKPLSIDSLLFNPLSRYDRSIIVPTEIDTFFRHELIHGKVHDEGAILMDGVSGNAGLFSNAHALGRLFEMLISCGNSKSDSVFNASTVNLFSSYQYPVDHNRRGIGFDKPLIEFDSVKSSVARSASIASFGHTGYTGTIVWADPKYDLVFVFLTNRVYPSRDRRMIYELNVRPRIQTTLYDYIIHKNGMIND